MKVYEYLLNEYMRESSDNNARVCKLEYFKKYSDRPC
jgi:hypothetical protein